MKKLLLMLSFFWAPVASFAQGSIVNDIAFKNLITGIAPAAGATVTVCTSAGTGIPCTPLATVYSDIALTVPLTNPLTADSNGYYSFYAAPGRYVVTVTGAGTSGRAVTYILPSDTSGNNAFTGNNTHSGTETFTGATSVGKLDNVFYVDGTKYPKTNVGTQQALIDAYTQGGGEVHATQGVTLDASLYSSGLINITSGGAITAASSAGTNFSADYVGLVMTIPAITGSTCTVASITSVTALQCNSWSGGTLSNQTFTLNQGLYVPPGVKFIEDAQRAQFVNYIMGTGDGEYNVQSVYQGGLTLTSSRRQGDSPTNIIMRSGGNNSGNTGGGFGGGLQNIWFYRCGSFGNWVSGVNGWDCYSQMGQGTVYATGTATATAASAAVTGSGTTWTTAMVGADFTINAQTTVAGKVCSVQSTTALTLCSLWGGASTGGNVAYQLLGGSAGTLITNYMAGQCGVHIWGNPSVRPCNIFSGDTSYFSLQRPFVFEASAISYTAPALSLRGPNASTRVMFEARGSADSLRKCFGEDIATDEFRVLNHDCSTAAFRVVDAGATIAVGKLGVGNQTPTATVDVAGTDNTSGLIIHRSGGTQTNSWSFVLDASGNTQTFFNDGTGTAQVTINAGSVTTAGEIVVHEGSAPSGSATNDLLWADSAAHRLKMNNNSGTTATIAGLELAQTWTAAQTHTGAAIIPDQTSGITGTTTNNNANTGAVGEYVQSVLATGSSVTLATGVTSNVTSISLTAGDWDVTGAVDFTFGATTSYTNLIGSVSSTSATIGGQDSKFDFETPAAVPTAGADMTFPLPVVRFSLSGTTTVFLVAQGTFTVSTLKAYGTIRARRIR